MSTSKKSKAGKHSGVTRAKLAKVRQYYVLSAFENLKPTHQMQPFSDESIDALEKEFRDPPQRSSGRESSYIKLPSGEYGWVESPRRHQVKSDKLEKLFDQHMEIMLDLGIDQSSKLSKLRNASRETLIKDLKALGISSKLRKQQPG